MQEVFISFQLSALIPVLIVVIYKPIFNIFFKILFASILLSIVFEILGNISRIVFKNNMPVYCIYYILNAALITYLWQKIPFYSTKYKNLVRWFGAIIVGIMIFTTVFYSFSQEANYIISCLSVFLGLILGLQYYYQKIEITSYTPLLRDPYFITASGFILFCLSTIVILAAQTQFNGDPNKSYTWAFRQFFYLIYNIIIAYAFYVLHLTQIKEKEK